MTVRQAARALQAGHADVAARAFFTMRDQWDRGGDMGHPEGFVFLLTNGDAFAVRLELWTRDCLGDLRCPTAAAATTRGEALARQWKGEGWRWTGYVELSGRSRDRIFGYTWAADGASEDEIEEAGEDTVEEAP